MSLCRFLIIFLLASTLFARGRVYVVLWFDTEDYIDPAADDAALRIANDLSALGVRATFKLVGEKARVLESRQRADVIQALSKHAIGFHSNWHSLHPTPSEYLRRFGYLEGADEFQRREAPGAADIQRIFGVMPICYGQPGSSWGPQSNLALRRMGIPVYLDEGEQVGLDEQPFWYGGLLYVFHMGKNQFRAELNAGDEDKAAYKRFDEAVARLSSGAGGVISIYYHPTEFITTEFWDAVNFAKGAMPARKDWVRPRSRTTEDSERCFHVLHEFVKHMKETPSVRFVTAQDLLQIYDGPLPPVLDTRTIAEHLTRQITFLNSGGATLSPADMLIQLLRLEPQVVDGPTAPGLTTWPSETIPEHLFNRAEKDAADFISKNHRLPNEVFIAAETLSLSDFTATLAAHVLHPASLVHVVRGRIAFDKYFATDAEKSFNWPIHPAGFRAPELLELGRLQGWTLKPARLRGSRPD
ncbi:MAG: hypothetical protein ACR2IV_08720 [Bryobacteraceae bacterium]